MARMYTCTLEEGLIHGWFSLSVRHDNFALLVFFPPPFVFVLFDVYFYSRSIICWKKSIRQGKIVVRR